MGWTSSKSRTPLFTTSLSRILFEHFGNAVRLADLYARAKTLPGRALCRGLREARDVLRKLPD